MFGRKLRIRLDLLQLDLGSKVRQQQAKQKQNHNNAHFKQRGFEVGTTVYVVNNHGTPKWLPGTIKQITCPALVLVKLSDECTFRRRTDDINVRSTQDFHEITSADSSTLPTQTVSCHSTRICKPSNHYV